MGLFSKLKGLFSSRGAEPHQLEVVVRCNRCGEVIHGHIDLYNDLSVEYDGDRTTYFCRKGLVGSGDTRCFQEVVVEYTFDANRNLIARRITGGQFVEKGEQNGME